MGAIDIERQAPNVSPDENAGRQSSAGRPRGDAKRSSDATIDEATSRLDQRPPEDTHLHASAPWWDRIPYPDGWCARFQSHDQRGDARGQIERAHRPGKSPTLIIACVGGGSNAMGLFHPFLPTDVKLLGIEPGGRGSGLGDHAATLALGTPGVLHGTYSLLLQNDDGQVIETHSVSAGLDYSGVGPEHAFLKTSGRASYETVTDEEAMTALYEVANCEGILVAVESAHAYAGAQRYAAANPGSRILIGCSGRGDKDLPILDAWEKR